MAIGPYSQATAPFASGRPIYLSGQLGLLPKANEKPVVIEGGIEAETSQALANIKVILETVHLTLADVLSVDVLLANMEDFGIMNKTYEKVFNHHKPARATYAVAQLPMGAKIEIKVIAWQSAL